MSEQTSSGAAFFYGVMVQQDGKWKPHSKYDGNSFGSALLEAEELDKMPEFETVKVLKIPSSGGGEQKEMWISPHVKALSDAKAATQLHADAKQSKQQLENDYAERKGTGKKT
jgi:hypothetical protein